MNILLSYLYMNKYCESGSHYAAAPLRQLNAAITDIRQELTYKHMYLDRQESVFFFYE